MKRAEKIALLTNVLNSNNTDAARKRLEHVVANAPRLIIIVDDLHYIGPPLTDTSPVQFQVKKQQQQMALGEVNKYARSFGIRLLIVSPVSPLS